MNKRYISLTIILLIAIGGLPTFMGQTHLEIPEIVNGEHGCYQLKLLQSVDETLQPSQAATYYPSRWH